MSNIDTESMIDVATTFQGSVMHALSNLTPESRDNIKNFIVTIILREKPYLLVGKEGIIRAIDLVFSKEEYRDFIFTLHYIFFSRWGNSDGSVSGLIGNVARGLGLSTISSNSIMPKEINNRLSDVEDVVDLLSANTWLLMLIFLQLFVSITEIERKEPSGR